MKRSEGVSIARHILARSRYIVKPTVLKTVEVEDVGFIEFNYMHCGNIQDIAFVVLSCLRRIWTPRAFEGLLNTVIPHFIEDIKAWSTHINGSNF
jgi:hypothetical protein